MTAFDGHHIVRALERVSVPVGMLDATGVIVWTNRAAKRLAGDGALAGQSSARFMAPADAAHVKRELERIVAGEVESAEELLGREPPFYPEGERERVLELRERALRGEVIADVGVRRLRRDGTVIDVSFSPPCCETPPASSAA